MLDQRYPNAEALQAATVQASIGMFGVNMTKWPDLASPASDMLASTYRLHDYSGGSATWRTRWQKMEPTKGNIDWGTLDSVIPEIAARGASPIFTVFGTPSWASARPSESSAYGASNLGIAAEPTDLQDLADFCTAVASRYRGQIRYYEIWNEVNAAGFYSGTQAKLAEMVRAASIAIKAADPAALVIAPSVTYLWAAGTGTAYFQSMFSASDGAGGTLKDWVDIVSVHMYAPSSLRLGEISGMVKRVRDAMQSAGVSNKPLWNTEFTVLGTDFASLMAGQRTSAIRSLVLQTLVSAYGACNHTIIYGPDTTLYGFTADDVAEYNALTRSLTGGAVSNVCIAPDGRISYSDSGSLNLVST